MKNLLVTVGHESLAGADGNALLSADNGFCGNTGDVEILNATLPVTLACVIPLVGVLMQIQKASGGDMMLNEVRVTATSGGYGTEIQPQSIGSVSTVDMVSLPVPLFIRVEKLRQIA